VDRRGGGGGERSHPQRWARHGFLAQENARKTLAAGVATVRDLGSSDYDDIAMRDLINRGAMVEPRMFVAGYGLHVTDRAERPGFRFPVEGMAAA